KIDFVEHARPSLLVLGNSRADNGIAPDALLAAAGSPAGVRAFNLGMPGANALVLHGVADRLLEAGARPSDVLITLDETLFQHEDSLGYYG
ncbi:hypothetical protein ABTH01_19660, partial [Acinetobacter baumannii]